MVLHSPPPLACEVAGAAINKGGGVLPAARTYIVTTQALSPADDVPWCQAAAHDQDGDGDGDGEEAASKKGEGDSPGDASAQPETGNQGQSSSAAPDIAPPSNGCSIVLLTSLQLCSFEFLVSSVSVFVLLCSLLSKFASKQREGGGDIFRPGCTSHYRGFLTLACLLEDGKIC